MCVRVFLWVYVCLPCLLRISFTHDMCTLVILNFVSLSLSICLSFPPADCNRHAKVVSRKQQVFHSNIGRAISSKLNRQPQSKGIQLDRTEGNWECKRIATNAWNLYQMICLGSFGLFHSTFIALLLDCLIIVVWNLLLQSNLKIPKLYLFAGHIKCKTYSSKRLELSTLSSKGPSRPYAAKCQVVDEIYKRFLL